MLFFPLTISLGLWQLERAEEKQALLDIAEKRAAQTRVSYSNYLATLNKVVPKSDMTGIPLSDPSRVDTPFSSFASDTDGSRWADILLRPMSLEGRYGEHSYLLDNKTHNSRVGYEVYTSFYLPDGQRVLVNRGWVAAPRLRDKFPEIEIPSGVVTLNGYFYARDAYGPVGEAFTETVPGMAWPKRLQAMDWRLFETDIGLKNLSGLEFRLADENQSGAYQTGWQLVRMSPEKHHGYAFQWFALAIALTVLTLIASFRSRSTDDSK